MGISGFDTETVTRGKSYLMVLAALLAIVILSLFVVSVLTGNQMFFWIGWGILAAAIMVGGRDGFR